MGDAAKRSGGATRFMVGGLVMMVAALGFLGWRWLSPRAEALPVQGEASSAPAAAPSEPAKPGAPAPSSGERLSG